jgi:hypothetical protein
MVLGIFLLKALRQPAAVAEFMGIGRSSGRPATAASW